MTDLPRRSKRKSRPPKPMYIPDLDFLRKEYFKDEELLEDQIMTHIYKDENFIPSDLEEDLEEEIKLDQEYIKKGYHPNQYLTKKNYKKQKLYHKKVNNDEEFVLSSNEEDSLTSDSDLTKSPVSSYVYTDSESDDDDDIIDF